MDAYLSPQNNPYTSYKMITTINIIQILYANYTRIYATDIAANSKRLFLPYNAKELLKSLIERLNKYVNFAAVAYELITETQLVHVAHGLVAETV